MFPMCWKRDDVIFVGLGFYRYKGRERVGGLISIYIFLLTLIANIFTVTQRPICNILFVPGGRCALRGKGFETAMPRIRTIDFVSKEAPMGRYNKTTGTIGGRLHTCMSGTCRSCRGRKRPNA